jgi:hypothetical protein
MPSVIPFLPLRGLMFQSNLMSDNTLVTCVPCLQELTKVLPPEAAVHYVQRRCLLRGQLEGAAQQAQRVAKLQASRTACQATYCMTNVEQAQQIATTQHRTSSAASAKSCLHVGPPFLFCFWYLRED